MSDIKRTTITISTPTLETLKQIGKKGETYEQIIHKLLEVYRSGRSS